MVIFLDDPCRFMFAFLSHKAFRNFPALAKGSFINRAANSVTLPNQIHCEVCFMSILFRRCPGGMKQFHIYNGILICLQKRIQTAVSKKAYLGIFAPRG